MDVVDAVVDYITELRRRLGIRYERDAVRYFVRNVSAHATSSERIKREITTRAVRRYEGFKKTYTQ
jgi:hypothetical protein